MRNSQKNHIFRINTSCIQSQRKKSIQKKKKKNQKMNAPDPSLISKSASSTAKNSQYGSDFMVKANSSVFFQLFDQMCTYIQISSIFYYLFLLVLAVQMIYLSIWPAHNKLFESSDVYSYIKAIACFTGTNPSESMYLYCFIAYTIVFVIVLATYLLQVFCFIKVRRFFKKTLYPTRLILELVPSVMNVPLANFVGEMFHIITGSTSKYAEDTSNIIYIVFFVLGIVELIFFIVMFIISNNLFGITPYINKSPLSCFDSDFYVRFTSISPFFYLINKIIERYSSWILHPFIVLHIAYCCFMFYICLYRPFVKAGSTMFFIGIIISSVINDVTRLIVIFIDNPNALIGVIMFFVFVVLSFVAGIIIVVVQTKFIEKMLKTFDPYDSDDVKKAKFKELGLDAHQNKCLLVLNYVWTNQFAILVDPLLIQYTALAFHSLKVTINVIKIAVFLPANSSSLKILSSNMMRNRNLSQKVRFFIYQVEKIKTLRQSSTSIMAIERLKYLKQASKELATREVSYFTRTETQTAYLQQVTKDLKREKSLWEEIMRSFPNSTSLIEEYTNFLIECATDFVEGIRQRHRSNLIDLGMNYNIDMCFRQFVKVFPNFLKKGIIDVKGNYIKQVKAMKGSNSVVTQSQNGSSNMFSSASSSSSSSQLDIQVEEGIGKQLITTARTRLALQRATQFRKANAYKAHIISSIIIFVIGIAAFIFLYVFFDSYFDTRGDNTRRIEYTNKIRLDLYATAFANLYYWGNWSGIIDNSNYTSEYTKNDDPTVYFYPPDSEIDWEHKAVYFSVDARDQFQSLLIDIAAMASDKIDVYYYGEAIFEEIVPVSYCDKGTPLDIETFTTLNTLIPYLLMEMTLFSSYNNNDWWVNATDVCSLYTSMPIIWQGFEYITNSLSQYEEDERSSASNLISIMMIAFPVVYGVLSIVMICTTSIRYFNEIRKFSDILLKLPSSIKQEVYKPLIKDSDGSMFSTQDEQSDNSKTLPLALIILIFICILFVVNALLLYFQISTLNSTNQDYTYLALWTSNARVRKCLVVELIYWLYTLIMLDNPGFSETKYFNATYLAYLAQLDFQKLDEATQEIMTETPNTPSSLGIDDEIDRLTLEEDCTSNTNSSVLHDQYRCSSVQHLINTLLNMASEIMLNTSTYGGVINDAYPVESFHLASSHLIPKLMQIDDRYELLSNYYKNNHTTSQTIYLVCELVITVIIFSLIAFITKNMGDIYSLVLTLLRRISPVSIVNTSELIGYILNENKQEKKGDMSTAQSVIYHSKDTVICLSHTGVIEFVNPSLTKTFGYTPEQLLGQSIETIIVEESKQQIMNQIDLMRRKQSKLLYDGHVPCLTDDDSVLQCAITIMAIENSNREVIDSFVVFLKDESELVQKQEVAEEAKKKSETLLFQILPRDIVTRLNQGEKDISFSVPSATIMFIDIVKFSEYAASLTPQEIMGNLSLVFAGFDEAIVKYPLLLKIKLIGDVYMCAGGLFTPDEPPLSHAEQMTKFALEALQVIEDTNVKLNAVLNVRIGINTGGPLIAGVLGTDKPTFDIIGDPINVASRLQSTDIAGKIQISQATYDLIKSSDFWIEPRGEVFLKGKGNQPAYLVSPLRNIGYVMSSSDIS